MGTPLKPGRIYMRVNPERRDLFERAAALETGGDLSKFILKAAEERAARILDEQQSTIMSAQTRRRVYQLLESPSKPTPALKNLMRKETKRFRIVE